MATSFSIQQAGDLKKGHYIFQDEATFKILEAVHSKTGKHGRQRVHFQIKEIFTGKKKELLVPSHQLLQVPDVKKTEYTVVDVTEDGMMVLMDDDNNSKI